MHTGSDPVLVILHGLPPRTGAPVSGMGLRAWTNGEGLRSHGFEVVYATRRSDAESNGAAGDADGSADRPLTFHHEELADLVARVDPSVILVEATDEVTRLPAASAPVVLDLFAPRLLERQFQGIDDPQEATRLLEAVGRADHYLFSNTRQRDYHLGLLTVAGVDCRRWPGSVVPLSCPLEAPRRAWPREPVLVTGGVSWPWIDAANPLGVVVEQLDRRRAGSLRLFGGSYVVEGGDEGALTVPGEGLPGSDRLVAEGFVPYEELLHAYARASLAVDLTLPNPERELSFSFRHVDYLRCGLPMLLADHTVAARELADAGAAVAVDASDPRAICRALDGLLDDPDRLKRMGRAARKLARTRHGWHEATAPLAAFCRRPRHRERSPTLLVRAAAERNRVADELEMARNRGDLLAERLALAEERIRRADREREIAWRHFREASEQLERTWASHGRMEEARDRAWEAHARTAADVDRALDQRDAAWEAHGTAVAAAERAVAERDRAWAEQDRGAATVERIADERDAAWKAHAELAAVVEGLIAERDAAWKAHGSTAAAVERLGEERDAAWKAHEEAVAGLGRMNGERGEAWRAHDQAVAAGEALAAERETAWKAHDDARSREERLRVDRDAAWRAHDEAVNAGNTARADRDAAWEAHDEAVAEARERTEERDRIATAELQALADLRRAEAEREEARSEASELRARRDALEGDLRGAVDAVAAAEAARAQVEAELRDQIDAIDDDRQRLEELLRETVGWKARRLVGRIRGREDDEPV